MTDDDRRDAEREVHLEEQEEERGCEHDLRDDDSRVHERVVDRPRAPRCPPPPERARQGDDEREEHRAHGDDQRRLKARPHVWIVDGLVIPMAGGAGERREERVAIKRADDHRHARQPQERDDNRAQGSAQRMAPDIHVTSAEIWNRRMKNSTIMSATMSTTASAEPSG